MRAKLDIGVKDLCVKLVRACGLVLPEAVGVPIVEDPTHVVRAEKGKAVVMREA